MLYTLNFSDIATHRIYVDGEVLVIGEYHCLNRTQIVGHKWQISAPAVHSYLTTQQPSYGTPFAVPAAAVLFDITHELEALECFFPLIKVLDKTQRSTFLGRLNALLRDPRLTIRGHHAQQVMTLPLSARALVAGQIVMCFFYSPDIITMLLSTKPAVDLFSSHADYERAGGVGGGCYIEREHRILLHVPRLYEGFFQQPAGVCPFLHEFGHMLDGTSMRLMQYVECRGELPGMSVAQRRTFAIAKAAEHALYLAHYHGRAPADGRHPLGHPYVFQTDGEFLAGYWEMFWRNPHSMASACPALYATWCDYTQCDPRTALSNDYMGYVEGNRAFYRSGERPWPSHIRYHIN